MRTVNGEMLPRTNYGVFFKPTGTMCPSSQYWKHTFQITLPKTISLPDLPLPCEPDVNTTMCQPLHRSIEHVNFIRTQGLQTINATFTEIYEIIPNEHRMQVPRHKRSLLPFLGKIRHSLFGLATDSDIATISQHIHKLEEHETLLFQELNHHNFSSFMKLADKRMTNTMNAVQFNYHVLQTLRQNSPKGDQRKGVRWQAKMVWELNKSAIAEKYKFFILKKFTLLVHIYS